MTLNPDTLLDACVKIRRVPLRAARVRWGTYSHSRFLRGHVVGGVGAWIQYRSPRRAGRSLTVWRLALGVERGNASRMLWGTPPAQISWTAVCNVGITAPAQEKQRTKGGGDRLRLSMPVASRVVSAEETGAGFRSNGHLDDHNDRTLR